MKQSILAIVAVIGLITATPALAADSGVRLDHVEQQITRISAELEPVLKPGCACYWLYKIRVLFTHQRVLGLIIVILRKKHEQGWNFLCEIGENKISNF